MVLLCFGCIYHLKYDKSHITWRVVDLWLHVRCTYYYYYLFKLYRILFATNSLMAYTCRKGERREARGEREREREGGGRGREGGGGREGGREG